MQKKYIVISLAIAGVALAGWLALPGDAIDAVTDTLGITKSAPVAIKQDSRKTLEETLFSWGRDTRTVINGHAVPPIPDPKQNNATVAGVDSDNNGIRDDLDRYIAEHFGNDPIYEDVVIYEKAQTKAVLNPTKENVISAMREISCVSEGPDRDFSKILKRTSALTREANSIGGRGGAYARAFAGTDIWSCNRK